MPEGKSLDTLWEIPDDLRGEIAPLIANLDPPGATGRKGQNPRRMLNGIIFRLRSGCQWNRPPRELGDDSTIHRTLQRWEQAGLFRGIIGPDISARIVVATATLDNSGVIA